MGPAAIAPAASIVLVESTRAISVVQVNNRMETVLLVDRVQRTASRLKGTTIARDADLDSLRPRERPSVPTSDVKRERE